MVTTGTETPHLAFGARGRTNPWGIRAILRSLYRLTLRLRLRLWQAQFARVRLEHLDGFSIVVLPGVFNGVLLRTGAFLATTLDSALIPNGAKVLDLGTGSGVGALFAARFALHVVAADINPEAVRCARINALANNLEDKIEARAGDLFFPVREDKFDAILFNPPFYRGRPRNLADHAWRSEDVFDRFLQEFPAHLTNGGRALVVLSSDGDITETLTSWPGLDLEVVRQRDFLNETLTVYSLRVKTSS